MKKTIGVLGAGTMGAGIAQVAAQSGHKVVLVDLNTDQLVKAKSNLEKTLSKLVEKGKIADSQKIEIESNIR
jgi:3-hydroxybutyryl-CoA dehydrogenase